MKSSYQQPTIKIIDLYGEDAILLQMSNTVVDTSTDDFEQRSNEKDMDLWGNENVWK